MIKNVMETLFYIENVDIFVVLTIPSIMGKLWSFYNQGEHWTKNLSSTSWPSSQKKL